MLSIDQNERCIDIALLDDVAEKETIIDLRNGEAEGLILYSLPREID